MSGRGGWLTYLGPQAFRSSSCRRACSGTAAASHTPCQYRPAHSARIARYDLPDAHRSVRVAAERRERLLSKRRLGATRGQDQALQRPRA
eukprot:3777109-Rhodomonas_salina.2